MGSGYASYDDIEFKKCSNFVSVQTVIASERTLEGFGKIVYNYDEEKVIIEQWPSLGKRPVMPGSGTGGGFVEGIFSFQWETGNFLKAQNDAVGGNYTVGKRIGNSIVTRELNFHGDGGQVVFPTEKKPFVLLLGKPGDDIQLTDIIAFICDGTFGVQILPNVWHQPVFPKENTRFKNKQGAVHACVGFDSVKEWGVWLKFDF